jgi:hypothetical protein
MLNYKEYFRKKFIDGYEGYEIVIALLTLLKEQKITEEDILPILDYVYMGNSIGVFNALNKARALVDDDLINEIIKEVVKDK